MSIARRSFLRAALNRRLQFSGPFTSTNDSVSLAADAITVIKAVKPKADDDPNMYPAGTILRIASSTKIKAHDRVIYPKYPNILYQVGSVSGQTVIDELDGQVRVSCVVTLHEPLDPTGLEIKLYIEGE